MASNLVVSAKSALSEEIKLSSLAEEVHRRLRNTSLNVDPSSRLDIIERVCTKMATSGHTNKFIRKVVTRGISNYTEKVKKSRLPTSDPNHCPLYNGRTWKQMEKLKQKAMKGKSWYYDKDVTEGKSENVNKVTKGKMKKPSQRAGNKVKTTTVIFVPSTMGGVLVRKLREREDTMSDLTGFRVKYQEAAGTKLANMFSTDLGRGLHCGRYPCPPCDTNSEEKRTNCKSSNILYESACMVCNPTEKAPKLLSSPQEDLVHPSTQQPAKRGGIYIGESSRSLHERSTEHVNDAQNLTSKSHIIKHWMIKHPDLPARPPFRFTITTKYRDALSRQVGEAMRIMMSSDDLLNSKSEYVRNCLTRITITEKDWEKKERERREEDQEKQEKEKLEEFIREKTESQSSSQLVENQDLPGPSCHEEEVLEHSRGIQNKKRRLNNSVRTRSWHPPTHHHDYNLRRWWRIAEKSDGDRKKPPLKDKGKKSPPTMNLTWFSYW